MPKLRGKLAPELRRLFDDPAARAAMSGVLLYAGIAPEQAPVTQIIGLVAMFDDGFHLPERGMQAIPDALSAAMLAHGRQIFTGMPVHRIAIANGRVSGVDVAELGVVPVDAVVSTVSGMLTAGSLLDPRDVPDSMRRRAERARLSQKALSVQLGLANALDVRSHSNAVLPLMERQGELLSPGHGTPFWLSYSVPTVTMPELAPPGGSIVEMFPFIDQHRSVDLWNADVSESVADEAIAALRATHELKIVTRRIRSPRDFRDGMHLSGGAVYGLSPAAGPWTQFPHKTPIDGLFQAGQTTYPGFGVGPATMSGVFAAEAMMHALQR